MIQSENLSPESGVTFCVYSTYPCDTSKMAKVLNDP